MDFCRTLQTTWQARRIAAQLFGARTAVGTNYRAAGRARSDSDIAKIGIVVEEADESVFWLDLLAETNISRGVERGALAREAAELRAIFVASRQTALSNRAARRRKKPPPA